MLLQPVSPSVDHRPFEYKLFDLGLIDSVAPTDPRLAARAALYARNVNYDRRTIAKRGGIQRVCENSPGATQISNFEPSETWVNVAGSSADTTDFVKKEVSGAGTQGRKLTQTGFGVAETYRTVSIDLSGNEFDVFSVWFKLVSVPTKWQVAIRFQTDASNMFDIFLGTEPNSQGDRPLNPIPVGGSGYVRVKRHAMVKIGSPSWSNITKIQILGIVPSGGTGTLTFTVDNLTRCPGRGQDLLQFRRLSDPTWKGAKDEYAVTDGRIYRLDEGSQTWTDLGLYFDPDAQVNHAVINDRLYLCDGKNKNRKVMPDGATIYQMGIDALTAPLSTSVATTGGSLANGDHYFAVTYYSTLTGVESAPHIRTGQKVTVSGGSGFATITYFGIPKSTDPQVTHVRIYRLSPTSSRFLRVSSSTDGEIVNGATSFTEGLADSQLGDELNPDLDAPKPTRFFAAWPELGILLGVFAETPTVVNFSSPVAGAGPENWAVEDSILVGRDDNDSVSGLHYDGLRALVFKANSILEGIHVGGEEFIRFRTMRTDRGSLAHKGILTVEGRTFYPGSDGIYALESGLSRKVMALAQRTWDELVFRERLPFACAVQLRSRFQYLLYFQEKAAAQNDLAWKIHHNSVLVDRNFSKGLGPGYTAASSLDDQSALAAAEVEVGNGERRESWILSADGQVYRIDAGTMDDGRTFTMTHRTSLLSPYGAGYLQHFVYLDLETKQTTSETLTVKQYLDATLATVSATLLAKLASDGADLLSDGFVYGSSVYGFALGQQRRLRLSPRSARRAMFQFEHSGIGAVEIYNLRLWADRDGQ